MGSIINTSQLTMDVLKRITNPLILCSYSSRTARLIENYKFNKVNLSIKLAEALLKFPQIERGKRANDEVMAIMSQCQIPTFFEDYEILFDPHYDINVIKVFTELARRQKVVVKWCGRLNGDSLKYATPEYRDYHSFRIQDCNIICVK